MVERNVDIVQSARNATVYLPQENLDLSSYPIKDGWFEEGFNNDATETDPSVGWPGLEYWTGSIGGVAQTWGFPTRFKATHCSLIPKGPHRGKLLLWNTDPVIAKSTFTGTEWWSWQAIVILDLDPEAETRCYNYLLPIAKVYETGGLEYYPSLFCAGHAWTEFGDLVIAGGNSWNENFGLNSYDGLWVWNPDATGAAYAPQGVSETPAFKDLNVGHYATFGAWVYYGPMLKPRWYATVKTTPRYTNGMSQQSAVLFFGGSDDPLTTNNPADNPSWNSYEAYWVTGSPVCTVGTQSTGLVRDTRNPPGFTVGGEAGVFKGPATSTASDAVLYSESLIYYAHIFQLTNGQFFMSGMASKSARLQNHGTNPGSWTLTPGHTLAGAWQKERMYGSSVMLPNWDGTDNRVLRVGGANYLASVGQPLTTTDETQTITADNAGASWVLGPELNYSSMEHNLVLTPDADIYLFGGTYKSFIPPDVAGAIVDYHTKAQRLSIGASTGYASEWELLYWSPAEAYRNYHSTAMLMPDGKVFTGGGDASMVVIDPNEPSHAHNPSASEHPGYDYEVFYPRYLRPTEAPAITYTRPQITGIATVTPSGGTYVLSYGSTYTVQCSGLGQFRSLSHLVLMAPGSRTHHIDFCENYYKPPTQSVTSSTTIQFTMPATDNVIPRGYYMLFVLDDNRVPSEAIWIKV